MTITLNKVLVGGVPLSVTNERDVITIGSEEYPIDEWREIERRIDSLITGKAGIRKREAKGVPLISNFVVENLPFINRTKKGRMKEAPFWLRPFYGGVITKEKLPDRFLD